jgi:hypothetical protein
MPVGASTWAARIPVNSRGNVISLPHTRADRRFTQCCMDKLPVQG